MRVLASAELSGIYTPASKWCRRSVSSPCDVSPSRATSRGSDEVRCRKVQLIDLVKFIVTR